MLLVTTIVKPSAIHGLGVFPATFVPAGTILWEFHPRLDILLTPEEVEALPRAVYDFVRHYGYKDTQQFKGMYVLHSGNDRFCNHSAQPTMITVPEGPCGFRQVAAYNLSVNDELTVDYGEYDARCAEPAWSRRDS